MCDMCCKTADPSKQDLTGKVVFLTTPPKMGYTGEYYIMHQTPNSIICVKMSVTDVYDMARFQTFYFMGDSAATILSVSVPTPDQIREFTLRMWEKGHAKERGEKLSWNESLYNDVKALARRIAERHAITLPTSFVGDPVSTPHSLERLAQAEARIAKLEQAFSRVNDATTSYVRRN